MLQRTILNQIKDFKYTNELLLYVYAQSEDIARLIGKKGSMANSIRQMLQVASKIENKRISIKFEAL